MAKEKNSLKRRICDWVRQNDNESVELSQIKQTNISMRKHSFRESYYFQCGNWTSSYTMKRWLEIAENKMYDSWDYTHGSWHWIKDNLIIN